MTIVNQEDVQMLTNEGITIAQKPVTEELPRVYQILGLEKAPEPDPNLPQDLQVINIIRQGFTIVSVLKVAEYCGISDTQMANLLATSERTISRRKKDNKPLDLSESDRLYRIARIFARALIIFENVESARNWLKKGNRGLAGLMPLELLDTDAGTEQVNELLNRIEYGLYS